MNCWLFSGSLQNKLTNVSRMKGKKKEVRDTSILYDFIALLVDDRKVRSGLYGFFPKEGNASFGYSHTGPARQGYEADYPKDTTGQD